MVSTSTGGIWKAVTGTLQEIVNELASDKITDAKRVVITHDGTNYVALYRYK